MPSVAQIQKLLAAEPADTFLNFSLGMALVKEGQLEEGVAQFGRVTSMSPDYVPAYFQQANTLVKLERRDEARAALDAGIAVARRTGDNHAASEMQQLLSVL